ncbi:mitochondrial K+-H+ exchange-related-domain-containing protein [Protomyces lactucae-debilis]|uniref:Mitochondrial K+-H+ exchange-related-domain-containing protein n=1 Tax=Protomyces lactucae-debilis TaxID=2754530 RepID=A0A1Y2FU58_PROLT|nr:mitochondrial K+-H+ exchange-related-domain-containing protein [Protomyces lactucae-debilis]ORY86834.1 mitochondrial K+-H+ exchange-related-domain-containing protein [Protomyces lactucae-debilis]
MKLYAVPLRNVSSKKIFFYAAPSKTLAADINPSVQDRVINKASSTWLKFEDAKSGWKKHLVGWGNKMIDRIDYREHALKSVMPQSSYDRYYPGAAAARQSVVLNHPSKIAKEEVLQQLQVLADEGYPRHRQKMILSLILAPLMAPFAIIPVVPNIPFFYVAYRAWSHYRAMSGSAHLQLLLKESRIQPSASKQMDELIDAEGHLQLDRVKHMFKAKEPQMTVEIERADAQLAREAQTLEQAAETKPAGTATVVKAVEAAQEQMEEAKEPSAAEVARNKQRQSRIGLHK